MAVVKARIVDTIYDVITPEEYYTNPEFYNSAPMAINGGDGYLYPVRTNPMDTRPGFYPGDALSFFIPPRPQDSMMYSVRNIIDFSQASSIRDIIESQTKLADAERAILTNIDSVFIPRTTPTDTPEMSLLKEAIVSKQIDLDKYGYRFGSNYNNDKRLINRSSITFGKLRAICKNLDIKATLRLEDASGDVPNPINKIMEVCLTDGFTGSDGDEEGGEQ